MGGVVCMMEDIQVVGKNKKSMTKDSGRSSEDRKSRDDLN